MIQGPQLIIVLVIVVLLFGGSKLPKLARGLGQAQKEFREGLHEGERPSAANASTDATHAGPASGDAAPGTPKSNPSG